MDNENWWKWIDLVERKIQAIGDEDLLRAIPFAMHLSHIYEIDWRKKTKNIYWKMVLNTENDRNHYNSFYFEVLLWDYIRISIDTRLFRQRFVPIFRYSISFSMSMSVINFTFVRAIRSKNRSTPVTLAHKSFEHTLFFKKKSLLHFFLLFLKLLDRLYQRTFFSFCTFENWVCFCNKFHCIYWIGANWAPIDSITNNIFNNSSLFWNDKQNALKVKWISLEVHSRKKSGKLSIWPLKWNEKEDIWI